MTSRRFIFREWRAEVEAAGGWGALQPPQEPVAWVLDGIFSNGNLDTLSRLLSYGSNLPDFADGRWPAATRFDGMSGEGWYLDRKTDRDLDTEWPPGTEFKAFIEPETCRSSENVTYLTRDQFYHYIDTIVRAYCAINPDNGAELSALFSAR